MKAKDIMSGSLVTARTEESLEVVANRMVKNRIGAVIIVNDDGDLAGIITESEFIGHQSQLPFSSYSVPKLWGKWVGVDTLETIYATAREVTAGNVMTKRVVTVSGDTDAETIAELMLKHNIKHVPVVKDGKPVGIVSRHDMVRLLTKGVRPKQ